MIEQQEIVNSSESRCSFKIESTPEGIITRLNYGQCSQEEIKDCIKKTIAAHNKIQGEAQKAQKGD